MCINEKGSIISKEEHKVILLISLNYRQGFPHQIADFKVFYPFLPWIVRFVL